jgi:uncharacterized protein DUF551
MNWISFKENLPKNNQSIKVKSENLWIGEGLFQDGEFVYSTIRGACFGDPTHWMPLSDNSPAV